MLARIASLHSLRVGKSTSGMYFHIIFVNRLLMYRRRNTKQQRALFPPTSVLPIIGSSPNCTIVSASVRANGAPVIYLSTGIAHSYDAALCSWVKLSDGWFAEGSDAWPARTRANTQLATRGIVSAIESTVTEHMPAIASDAARPAWWASALTLGHLETRMHTAKTLDSPQEYKHALVLYAKKIADEGFRAKAEELVKELFGPTYWCVFGNNQCVADLPDRGLYSFRRPGREESWSPTLLGFSKRDLLKDVLNIFGMPGSFARQHLELKHVFFFSAKSKTLTKLALDWQDTLKKAASEE